MNWAYVTGRRAFFLMWWHDTLLYVGLQWVLHWVGKCYKLLNPGQTIEIIWIIQDIMRIIVFSQLNMWLCFIKRAWLVIPKLCWHSWTLIGHRSAHWMRIGVLQLLKKGMLNPDIIRNNSKNNRYNSEIIVKQYNQVIVCCDIIGKIIRKIIRIIVNNSEIIWNNIHIMAYYGILFDLT